MKTTLSLRGEHYALCDNMGSKVAITNQSGTVTERFRYDAFGASQPLHPNFSLKPSSSWTTRFHGEERDPETGYYNYGYRYYLPKLGRFTSRDPIEEQGGLNSYAFTEVGSVREPVEKGFY